jgi:Uncharacterised nucleotidyltransferase
MTTPGLVQPPPRFAWLQALRQPELTLTWQLADWERTVRLSRRLRLLARLAESLRGAGLMEQVPAVARRHLLGERRLSQWRIQAVTWALDRIDVTLAEADYPKVLLKCAAYIGQGLPIAAGRLPSDLDILVPLAHLPDALARLEQAGWSAGEIDEHDSRYYRDWSHEVPPMTHALHRIELDLHHNILPPVARTHVDAGLLLARLQPSKWPAWQVLHPVDQVLHSAAHLFLDSELQDRLRDLVDLDGLLRQFGTESAFWAELPPRARQLGLTEPLALACHFTTRWLGTPIPAAVQAAVDAQGPSPARRAWLLPLMAAVLTPTEPDDRPSFKQNAAALVVLARHHRQRMPLRLLVPHLWHKMRTRDRVDGDGGGTAGTAAP